MTELGVSGTSLVKGGDSLPNAVETYLENLKKRPFFAEPNCRIRGGSGGKGLYAGETPSSSHSGGLELHPLRRRLRGGRDVEGTRWRSTEADDRVVDALGSGLGIGIGLAGAAHYRAENVNADITNKGRAGEPQEEITGRAADESFPSFARRSKRMSSSPSLQIPLQAQHRGADQANRDTDRRGT